MGTKKSTKSNVTNGKVSKALKTSGASPKPGLKRTLGSDLVATPSPSNGPWLNRIADSLRDRMGKGATEPLGVAQLVVDLACDWTHYQEEAGGLSCSAWLEKVFGKGKNLLWFSRRDDAVKAIGEHARRAWDHDAAVWATSRIKDKRQLKVLDRLVLKSRLKNGGNPLPTSAVQRLAREAGLVSPPKSRTCTRCMMLEQALAKAGIRVDDALRTSAKKASGAKRAKRT